MFLNSGPLLVNSPLTTMLRLTYVLCNGNISPISENIGTKSQPSDSYKDDSYIKRCIQTHVTMITYHKEFLCENQTHFLEANHFHFPQ